jgi:hypothetical protein
MLFKDRLHGWTKSEQYGRMFKYTMAKSKDKVDSWNCNYSLICGGRSMV